MGSRYCTCTKSICNIDQDDDNYARLKSRNTEKLCDTFSDDDDDDADADEDEDTATFTHSIPSASTIKTIASSNFKAPTLQNATSNLHSPLPTLANCDVSNLELANPFAIASPLPQIDSLVPGASIDKLYKSETMIIHKDDNETEEGSSELMCREETDKGIMQSLNISNIDPLTSSTSPHPADPWHSDFENSEIDILNLTQTNIEIEDESQISLNLACDSSMEPDSETSTKIIHRQLFNDCSRWKWQKNEITQQEQAMQAQMNQLKMEEEMADMNHAIKYYQNANNVNVDVK